MSLEWSAEDVNRVRDNPRDMQALRAAVEHAKLQLSTKHKTVTHVHLESHPQQQFQYTVSAAAIDSMMWFELQLSRDELNTVCAPLMQRILQPVRAAIVDADVTIDDVDEIVLVGGSTLVPRVRQIIGEYFK
jgi:molecular chaperone DnaK (HSP70)